MFANILNYVAFAIKHVLNIFAEIHSQYMTGLLKNSPSRTIVHWNLTLKLM